MLDHNAVIRALEVDVPIHLANRSDCLADDQCRFSLYKKGTYFDMYSSQLGGKSLLARVEARSDDSSSLGVEKEHALLTLLSPEIRPEVYYFSSSAEALGFNYRLETYYEQSMEPLNEASLLRDAARLLAQLHTAEGEFSSLDLCQKVGGGLAHLLDVSYAISPELERLRSIAIEVVSDLSNSRERTCLVHGDIHYENFLRTNDKTLLIDWEHASIDDPALDVAELFCFPYLMKQTDCILPAHLQELFFEDYIARTNDSGIAVRVDRYLVLVTVLHLISWDLKAKQLARTNSKQSRIFSKLVADYLPPIDKLIRHLECCV